MLLLDIGNTQIKTYQDGIIKKFKLGSFPKEKFFYINVNQKISIPKNGVDIKDFFSFKTNYENLGIDRIAACYTIENGIIVDAGSAITIDVMEKGEHKGGVILPGLRAYQKSFATISPILDIEIKTKIPCFKLPNSTKDAISFGVLCSITALIEKMGDNKKVYLTGGDGEIFLKFLKNAVYDETLIFKGMIKAIKERYADNSAA